MRSIINTFILINIVTTQAWAQGVRGGLELDGPSYSNAPEWPMTIFLIIMGAVVLKLFFSLKNWLPTLIICILIGYLSSFLFEIRVIGFYVGLLAFIPVSHYFEEKSSNDDDDTKG